MTSCDDSRDKINNGRAAEVLVLAYFGYLPSRITVIFRLGVNRVIGCSSAVPSILTELEFTGKFVLFVCFILGFWETLVEPFVVSSELRREVHPQV